MAEVAFEPMSLGGIFDRTFSLYRRNFARFLAIVAVVTVPLWLLDIGVTYAFGAQAAMPGGGVAPVNVGPLIAFFPVLLLTFLGTSLSNAALLRSVSESYLDREVTVGQAYGSVLRRLPTVLAAGILTGVVCGIGFVLCVVPGVIFSLWFALTVPAIVVENLGAMAGMRRSRRLGAGNLDKVFCVLLVTVLISAIVSLTLGWVGGRVGALAGPPGVAGHDAVALLFSLAAQTVTSPIGATALILLYYDLRIRKEGFDLEMLAQTLGLGRGAADGRGPAR